MITDDFLDVRRKAAFGKGKLGEVQKVIITPSIEKSEFERPENLGIEDHSFKVII